MGVLSGRDSKGPEEVFEAFESAWQSGSQPSIEEHLDATPVPRSVLLAGLVHMDLEYRLKAGQATRVEEYLQRFQELREDTAELLELLQAERWHRIAIGSPPEPHEYFERFPELRSQMQRTPLDPERTEFLDYPGVTWVELPEKVGNHRVLDPINEGGMGQIVRLDDGTFRRQLAMKVLKAELHDDQAAVERLLLEAQITGHLQHPGIPPVLEMGELPDGRPYFIMKLIEGKNLKELLRQRKSVDDRQVYFLGVFEQICQTVAYAHERGIIHRDLKPDNVMVGEFGEVQVMDWGLAKELNDPASSSVDNAAKADTSNRPRYEQATPKHGDTKTGDNMGTPPYMPPEQAQGRIKQMDRRSDVFGLGGILCEILTNKPPYQSAGEFKKRDLAGARSRLDSCGADTEVIHLAKLCLALDPKNRPEHAGAISEIMADYQEVVRQRVRQAEIDNAKAKVERQRRRAWMVGAFAVIVVLMVGIISTAWWATEAIRFEKQLQDEQAKSYKQNLQQQAESYAHAAELVKGAELAVQRGRWLSGLEFLDKALATERFAGSVQLRLNQVRVLFALNKLEAAHNIIQELGKQENLGEFQCQVQLAQADLFLANDETKAVALIRKALDGPLPKADRFYAQAILAETTPEVVRLLHASLAIDPYQPRARMMLNTLLVLMGRRDELKLEMAVWNNLFPEDRRIQIVQLHYALQIDDEKMAKTALQSLKPQFAEEEFAELESAIEFITPFFKKSNWQNPSCHPALGLFGPIMAPKHVNAIITKLAPQPRVDVKYTDMPTPPALHRAYGHTMNAMKMLHFRDRKEVIDELKKALAIHPEGSIRYLLAVCYFGPGIHFAEAEAEALSAAQMPSLLPIQRQALWIAAVSQLAQGSALVDKPGPFPKVKAGETLRKVMSLGKLVPYECQLAANIALKADRLDLCNEVLEQWQALEPKNTLADAIRAQFEFLQDTIVAKLEFKAEAYGKAIAAADRVLVKQPKNQEIVKLREDAVQKMREQLRKLAP